MAADKNRAINQLNDITQCCICLKTFTDPRKLPCIHTFCFQCLQDLVEKSDKKPGDEIQCPICRKQFILPGNGVQAVQKNIFIAGLIYFRNALNKSKMALPCYICKANNDSTDAQISEATMRCLVCQENLCEGCCKMHKSVKMSKSHEIIKIGSELGKEEVFKTIEVMYCDIHRRKPLDYYCADCKKVVCISCYVESHRARGCTDVHVSFVEDELRQHIKTSANILSTFAEELQNKRKKMESKEEFLKKIATREREILLRNKELKDMIDENTKSVLSSLDEIKNRHLKEIQVEEEELDRRFTILESFSRYYDELRSKRYTSEVCIVVNELVEKVGELEKDHETYIMRPRDLFDVTFQATEFENLLMTANGNIIGRVNEKFEQLEDFIVMIGGDETTLKLESFKINLSRQSDIIHHEFVPEMENSVPAGAVYNNTLFLSGVGKNVNEIWKYDFASGWKRCGSLVQRRQGHCAEFIGETLYICGGWLEDVVMDSIEAYNALTEKSETVGQLKVGVYFAACVAYSGSLYIFGGLDNDGEPLDCVQMFTPVECASTLQGTALPEPHAFMQAVLWRTYAILLTYDTCFVFDFGSKIWLERKQFQADAYSFGMVLEKERIFTIGGAFFEGGGTRPECLDDVFSVSASSIVNNEEANWKTHSHLPKRTRVLAIAKLTLLKS